MCYGQTLNKSNDTQLNLLSVRIQKVKHYLEDLSCVLR